MPFLLQLLSISPSHSFLLHSQLPLWRYYIWTLLGNFSLSTFLHSFAVSLYWVGMW
jgi:hypothetical protein